MSSNCNNSISSITTGTKHNLLLLYYVYTSVIVEKNKIDFLIVCALLSLCYCHTHFTSYILAREAHSLKSPQRNKCIME